MARQTLALAHELSSQRADQWSGPPSSCGQSLGRREPPYLFLDPVDRLDTGHRRRAELGRLAVVNVEYLATQMGQAGGFPNGATLVELVIAAEAVGLERAGKSGELAHHALAYALGHHSMGERGIAELAACNGLGWCRRLDERPACAAGWG